MTPMVRVFFDMIIFTILAISKSINIDKIKKNFIDKEKSLMIINWHLTLRFTF
jgi:2'-5' RNA ligase